MSYLKRLTNKNGTKLITISVINKDSLHVLYESLDDSCFQLRISSTHKEKLLAYKSLAALVKYAQANQTQPQAENSCPAPAKLQGISSPRPINDVSTVNANANASASLEGRGIFLYIKKPLPDLPDGTYSCPYCPDRFNEPVQEPDGFYSPCCGHCLDVYLPFEHFEPCAS